MDVVTAIVAMFVFVAAVLALLSARRNARQARARPIPNRVLLRNSTRTHQPEQSRPLDRD